MKKKGYKSLIVFLIMFLFLVSAVVALTFAKDKVQSFVKKEIGTVSLKKANLGKEESVPNITQDVGFLGDFTYYDNGLLKPLGPTLEEYIGAHREQGYLSENTATAEVVDENNRIYREDISATPGIYAVDKDTTITIVADVSNSMLFPASLEIEDSITGGQFEGTMFEIVSALNSTIQGQPQNKSKVYYFVTDRERTFTLNTIIYLENQRYTYSDGQQIVFPFSNCQYPGWYAIDTASFAKFMAGEQVDGIEGRITFLSSISPQNTDTEEFILYKANEGYEASYKTPGMLYGKAPNSNRLSYLVENINTAIEGIQEINSIISNAEIKIALETFANDVVQPFSEIDEFPEELTTNKGTRQDIALSKLNENEDFNNFIDEAEENYVILITDGILTIDGEPATNEVENVYQAANALKDKNVKLVTVGLSMKDVPNGAEMLIRTASDVSEGTKLAFGAENSEDFSSIMAGIIDEVLSKITIEMDVIIPIDPAFYLVNEDGSMVEYGLNDIENTEYGTNEGGEDYLEFKDVTLEGRPWNTTIYLKAKEDFLGGNSISVNNNRINFICKALNIPTLNIDSSVDALTFYSNSPYVNVNSLEFTSEEATWETYTGDFRDVSEQIINIIKDVTVEERVYLDGFEQKLAYGPVGMNSQQTNDNVRKELLKNILLFDRYELTQEDENKIKEENTLTKNVTQYGHNIGRLVYEVVLTGASADSSKSHKVTEDEEYTIKVRFEPLEANDTIDYITGSNGTGLPGMLAELRESVNKQIVDASTVTLSFDKIDGDGNYITEDFDFELYRKATAAEEDEATYLDLYDVKVVKATTQKEIDGSRVTFRNIEYPIDGELYLVETMTPPGYESMDCILFSISYDEVKEAKRVELDNTQNGVYNSYIGLSNLDIDEKIKIEDNNYFYYDASGGSEGFYVVNYTMIDPIHSITVYHYLIGTTTPVKLANGDDCLYDEYTGYYGEHYEIIPKDDSELAAGYTFVESSEPLEGEYEQGYKEIICYYDLDPTREKDVSYTINYYKDDVLQRDDTDVVETKIPVLETSITVDKNRIDTNKYDGYVLDEDKTIIPDIVVNGDEINVYYSIRNDLSYKVNYLEKDTDKVLHEAKTENNQTFGTVINSIDEAIDIDGYNYESTDPETLTIGTGTNEINIYYTEVTGLSYKVNYLEEGTTDVKIRPTKVQGQMDYGVVVNASDEVIDIEGYKFIRADKESITMGNDFDNSFINLYYEKLQDSTYTVKYIDKDTGLDIAPSRVETKKVETVIYAESEVIDIEKYEFVEYDKEYIEIGLDEDENVITLFYEKGEGTVYVHYYKEGTTEELADTVTLNGKYDTEYHSQPAENIDENYELVGNPDNKDGIYEVTPKEVNYFYKLKDAVLIVEYKEKGTDETVSESRTENTKRLEKFNLEDFTKEIDGYVLDREFTNEEFTIDDDTVTKVIYYEPKGKVIVHYVDKDNPDVDLDKEEKEDIVGETYETTSKNIEGYALVESPQEPTVTITKDTQDVYYYYKKVSKGLIEKHIDEDDNSILHEEPHTGVVGEEYEINPKEFDRYELDEENLPTNNKGTYGDEVIEVVYKYKYIAKVTANYVDQDGEKIVDPVVVEGNIGDDYKTEQKEFKKYEFVETVGNPEGEMTREDIEVTYRYQLITNKVIENHIDVLDDEVLFNEEHQVSPGDEYSTKPKDLENYDVVVEKLPLNGSGEMGNEDIVINYYYIRKAEVNVEYLDFFTGKPITDEQTIKGHVGDKYDSKEQNVPGYKLVKEQYPENASGSMTKDPTTVTYFYVKETKVVERHVYKDTVLYEETHLGLEGDEYEVKERTFENYIIDETSLPKNSKGFMDEDEIVVTFRYVEKAVVIEKHIDEDTKEILAYEKHEGKIGDRYNISARTFPGYDKMYATTDNNRGEMTKEQIEVIFYYAKTKKETPAKQEPKAQEPAAQSQNPVTVVVQDSSGKTTSTVTAKSGDTVVVKKDTSSVTPKVDPDYEIVRNVPDTDSETNRVFYAVSGVLVLLGIAVIVVVIKKKNKK